MESSLLVLCATALILLGTESVVASLQPIPTPKAVALYVLQTAQYQSSEASMVYTDSTTGKTENIEPVAMCPFVGTCFGVRVPRGPIFQIPTNAKDIRVRVAGQTDLKVNNPKGSGVFIQRKEGESPTNNFDEAPEYSTGNVKVLKVRLYDLEELPGTEDPEYASEKLSPYAKYSIRPASKDKTAEQGSPEIQQIGFALRQVNDGSKVSYEKQTVFAVPSDLTLAFCFGHSKAEFYDLRDHTEICYTPTMEIPYQELEIPGSHMSYGVFYGDANDSDKGALLQAASTNEVKDSRENKVMKRMRKMFSSYQPVRFHKVQRNTNQEA